jgi:ubiquinone/menaquinone biosynthesis C-methylase UbiE
MDKAPPASRIDHMQGFLDLFRCPAGGGALRLGTDRISGGAGGRSYEITASGIPLFAKDPCSADARVQQAHYDGIAQAYVANLNYAHTQEYLAYLDRALLDATGRRHLGDIAEICCGRGEAFHLVAGRISRGVGIDISVTMLDAARRDHRQANLFFAQGDATRLPLADAVFDTVFMLGGIHHVKDRAALFGEVARILKPGGRFYFREPVSDLWLWRLIRAVIYRVSPTLDHATEQPLRYSETAPFLSAAGLNLVSWRSYGFFGFCLLMNSDVLIFNRLFRFIPGIRAITRAFARFDDWVTSRRGWTMRGLQVVGAAEKPVLRVPEVAPRS